MTTSPDWAALPEAYLGRLIGFLPQSDLGKFALVCRKWADRQKRTLKAIEELSICIGDVSILIDSLNVFTQKATISRVNLPYLKRHSMQQLLGAFPKLTHLCLSASDMSAKHAAGLVTILTGLAPTLVKLHLVVTFQESIQGASQSAASLEILRAVNALPHLKTLTFDIEASLITENNEGTATSSKQHLLFPVLFRLFEFNLKTQDDAKYFVESFRNFGSGASLQTIRLESFTFDSSSWEEYLKLDGRVLAHFKHLKVIWQVGRQENTFGRLFPLLTSLTHLDFEINGEAEEETQYSDAVTTLASLKSLKMLKLKMATYLPSGQRKVPVELPQLTGIQKLSLAMYADCHEEDLLGPCYLDWVFGNLKELSVHFIIRGCDECGYDQQGPLPWKIAKNCAKQLYGQQMKQLKIKEKGVTFEWELLPEKVWSTYELALTD